MAKREREKTIGFFYEERATTGRVNRLNPSSPLLDLFSREEVEASRRISVCRLPGGGECPRTWRARLYALGPDSRA